MRPMHTHSISSTWTICSSTTLGMSPEMRRLGIGISIQRQSLVVSRQRAVSIQHSALRANRQKPLTAEKARFLIANDVLQQFAEYGSGLGGHDFSRAVEPSKSFAAPRSFSAEPLPDLSIPPE